MNYINNKKIYNIFANFTSWISILRVVIEFHNDALSPDPITRIKIDFNQMDTTNFTNKGHKIQY